MNLTLSREFTGHAGASLRSQTASEGSQTYRGIRCQRAIRSLSFVAPIGVLALVALTAAVLAADRKCAVDAATFQMPFPGEDSDPGKPAMNQDSPAPAKNQAQVVQQHMLSRDAGIPAGSWAPPEIDDASLELATDTPCPLSQILESASHQAEVLATNLQSFSASELVEQEEVGSDGRARMQRNGKFEYYVAVWATREGWLNVDEDRLKGRWSRSPFDKAEFTLESSGIAAHALIFHRQALKNYAVRCEGLGEHRGQPAWVLRFEQRADRPRRTRGYRVHDETVLVGLKGRAWVNARTGEVLRIATDLISPLEEIRLKRDHRNVEYRHVEFPKRSVVLWLPEKADTYIDFRGHKFRERHLYSDYSLFWVDTQQTIQLPKQP